MPRSLRTRAAVALAATAVVAAGTAVSWPRDVATVEPLSAPSAELSTTSFAGARSEVVVAQPISVPADVPGPAAAPMPAVPAASPPPPPPPPVIEPPTTVPDRADDDAPTSRGGQPASRGASRSTPAAPAAPAAGEAAPAPVASSPSYAGSLASGVNAQRAANGLAGLASSGCAQSHAQAWAKHLAATGSFEHQALGPVLSGCGGSAVGENIARTGGSASSMVTMWMESPGHRANILDGGFTHSGVAAVQAADGQWFGVQVFLTL